jgi:hypothetical protein
VIWAIIAPGRGRAVETLSGCCHPPGKRSGNRITGKLITFRHPFTLSGLDGIQPPGNLHPADREGDARRTLVCRLGPNCDNSGS